MGIIFIRCLQSPKVVLLIFSDYDIYQLIKHRMKNFNLKITFIKNYTHC